VNPTARWLLTAVIQFTAPLRRDFEQTNYALLGIRRDFGA
jgi:hypothetical protein